MERLFGATARNQLRDDCSLRGEIIDAKIDRDVRIAALVSQLQRFVGIADTVNALDPLRLEEARRQRVAARFDAWISALPAAPAQPA